MTLVHITMCRQVNIESMTACPKPAKYQNGDAWASEDYACDDHIKSIAGIPMQLILTEVEIEGGS